MTPCQCSDEIQKGDVLLIPTEHVVGIADTWPWAITEAHGDLHQLKEAEPIDPELAGLVALFNFARVARGLVLA
jgi:hypothetical protein